MQLGAQPMGPKVKVAPVPASNQLISYHLNLPPSPATWFEEPILTPTATTEAKSSLKMTNKVKFRQKEDQDLKEEEGKGYAMQTNRNYQQRHRHKHKRRQQQTKNLSPLMELVIKCLLFITLLSGVSCVVVYQVRFIASKSGRTDYVLAGESVELSCHYMMKDEAEDIKQLVWSKDGKNFLRWRKNRPGLEVLSYTFKGHVDPTSMHSHLIIHNATIDMHGKYKCTIKTDLGTHESEHDLVVISHGQCRLNDWRITSEQLRCREMFRLDCRQMFPRPVPSCGLWNDKLDKFIRSVTVDISEEVSAAPVAIGGGASSTTSKPAQVAPQQTYRVKYSDKFELTLPNGSVNPLHADLLQYADHLIFKCDILVPDTSWKLSLRHKMFDFADGCNSDPLETIERMRVNFSQLARMRLHKHYQQRPLDDIEMLTSNLKYEILPPPTLPASLRTNKDTRNDTTIVEASYQMLASVGSSNSTTKLSAKSVNKSQQHNPVSSRHLNCWQRPRVGSLAKLSCVPQGSNHKAQIKLSGTNLLECRPNGHWAPVSPRAVSSSIVVSNEWIDSKRRAKAALKKASTVTPSTGVRRSTRRLQDVNEPAGSQRQLTSLTSSQVDTDKQNDGNSLALGSYSNATDDDSDDSSPPLSGPSNEPDHITGGPMLNELEVGPLIPSTEPTPVATGRDDDDGQNLIDSHQVDADLTPGELASLLPSCVLINTNHHHQGGRRNGGQRHQLASSTNDRLPLLDDEGTLLESTYPATSHNRHFKSAHGEHKGTNGDDWRWYTFLSSSGAHSSQFKLNQRSHYISLTIVLFTTTAMLPHLNRILRI